MWPWHQSGVRGVGCVAGTVAGCGNGVVQLEVLSVHESGDGVCCLLVCGDVGYYQVNLVVYAEGYQLCCCLLEVWDLAPLMLDICYGYFAVQSQLYCAAFDMVHQCLDGEGGLTAVPGC